MHTGARDTAIDGKQLIIPEIGKVGRATSAAKKLPYTDSLNKMLVDLFVVCDKSNEFNLHIQQTKEALFKCNAWIKQQ